MGAGEVNVLGYVLFVSKNTEPPPSKAFAVIRDMDARVGDREVESVVGVFGLPDMKENGGKLMYSQVEE